MKSKIVYIILALGVAGALAVSAAPDTQPDRAAAAGRLAQPASQPVRAPALAGQGPLADIAAHHGQPGSRPALPRAVPERYASLFSHSMFSKTGLPGPGGPGGPGDPGMPTSPEAALIFRGVGLFDGRFTAFIENPASKQMQKVQLGDALAGGRVAALTLDRLDYELGGKIICIALGQTLAGIDAPPPPAAAPPGGPPNGPAIARQRGPNPMPGAPATDGAVTASASLPATPDGNAEAPHLDGQPGPPTPVQPSQQ